MDFGVHLPLLDFGGTRFDLAALTEYAAAAQRLGFAALAANDHLVFTAPWLDGPTALAAVLRESGRMTLMTTVALPVVRGPVPLAKQLAAIDRLSGGRLVAGVGPGSSREDYAAAGVPFEERWPRFEESIPALRALWRAGRDASRGSEPFVGRFYSTEGLRLEPRPARVPPIWIGSWGSPAGLRRTARLADGWLASAYNTTPAAFRDARAHLGELLAAEGRDPDGFPNALSTLWFHITNERAEAERVFGARILPAIHRPEDVLRDRIPVGPPAGLAEKLAAFRRAGVQRVFLWPVADEVRQLTRFREEVVPLLEGA